MTGERPPAPGPLGAVPDAVTYPFSMSRRTALVGVGCAALSLLLVPALVLLGYLCRVLVESAAGESEAPEFGDDWRALATDGGVVAGGVLAVVVGPLVLFGAFLVAGSVAGSRAVLALGLLGGAVAALPFFLGMYVLPAAVTAWASDTDAIREAVRATALSRGYLAAWLGSNVVLGIGLGVWMVTVLVPPVAVLAGPVVGFVTLVAASRPFGRAFRRGRRESNAEPSADAVESADDSTPPSE